MDIFYIYVNKYSLERITMKKKITIIGALILFSVAAFAQIIYTYHCLHCGSVKQSTSHLLQHAAASLWWGSDYLIVLGRAGLRGNAFHLQIRIALSLAATEIFLSSCRRRRRGVLPCQSECICFMQPQTLFGKKTLADSVIGVAHYFEM